MVKQGTLWSGGNGKNFRVVSVADIDGHTWVHYREEHKSKVITTESREYSCYEESFVTRFWPVVE